MLPNQTAQTAETQAQINPAAAVEMLKAGNERFLNNQMLQRDLGAQIGATSKGQYPFATVISCIDSRMPTETIFDQGIGDIFNARIAGNFVNADILGSLEFACKLAGSKVVVVMGHTSCGAVKGACDHASLGNLTQMLDKIAPAVDAVETDAGEARDSTNLDFVNKVSAKNVELTIKRIRRQSPVLNEMEEDGEIAIIGAMYDVKSGTVTFY
ncbi:MAG: carbonic anhydrase family protein [Saprospiraceae bacterium]